MIDIVCDFETRSRVALDDTNSYKYARHSSTEVLCMSYSIDGGPIQIWVPDEPFPFKKQWPNIRITAFNGEFELVIWNFCCTEMYGWPELKPEQIDCLQARSAYAGLPRNLEDVGHCLGLGKIGKDKEGNKNLKQLTRPQKVKGNPVKKIGCEYFGGEFDFDGAKHERNFVYCANDSQTELMVDRIVPELPESERELWAVHQRINQRGVPVDVDLCRKACWLVDKEYHRLTKRLAEVTGREDVTPDCNVWIKDWLRERGYPYHSLDEQAVTMALGLMPDCPPPELSDECKEVLNIRRLCRNSAVSKYEAILNHAEADGRCRGAHVFYKAGPGRFAGAGVNFLNLVRMLEHEVPMYHELADRISEADDDDLHEIYEELRAGNGVIPTLGAMVRAAVCAPPGYKLVDIDFKSIEYRKLHWLAGDERELQRIADFDKGIGEEPYKLAAAEIFRKKVSEVTKAERQIGKVLILACGYLGGAQTFMAFCALYGIEMSMERATELVQAYRRMYPMVKSFWYDAGRCAVKTIETGRRIKLRHVEFFMEGTTLNIKLPSGRLMKYYDATVVDGLYGPEVAALDQRTCGIKAVGLPILVENMDQGSSRDIMTGSLIRSDYAKLPVCLHVYDSIMMCVRENDMDCERVLTDIMRETPKWAEGLPLSTDMKVGRRMT